MKKAFAELYAEWDRPPAERPHIAVASLKTNIGHLEAAAGIAGLLKVLLSMRYGELPPSLHFDRPNPYLRLDGTPFFINDRLRKWEGVGEPGGEVVRRAGLSSFGFGGTNAHIVLEAYEPHREPVADDVREPRLLVLSARTGEALAGYARRLARHLAEHPEAGLDRVAYTLQLGREPMAERLSLVVEDREHAVRMLADAAEGAENVPGLYRGRARKDASAAGDYGLDELARAWTEGASVEWPRLWPGERPRRLSLPSFPFARTEHWFDSRRVTPEPETAPDRTTSVDPVAPDHTASADRTAPDRTASDRKAPGHTAPDRASSDRTASGRTAPVQMEPALADSEPHKASLRPVRRNASSASPDRVGKVRLAALERRSTTAAASPAHRPVSTIAQEPHRGAETGPGLTEDSASTETAASTEATALMETVTSTEAATPTGSTPATEPTASMEATTATGSGASTGSDASMEAATATGSAVSGRSVGSSEIAGVLRERLSSILGTDPADVAEDTPFAELGLDSIFRMELVRLLNTTFSLDLQASELYEYDTVERLTQAVEEAIAVQNGEPAMSAQPSDDRPAEPEPEAGADTEDLLSRLIGGLVDRPLDPARSFADNGLTSFDMLRVVSDLEKRFGAQRKTLLFDQPNLPALAAHLTEEHGSAAARRLGEVTSRPAEPVAQGEERDGEPLILLKRGLPDRPELREVIATADRKYAKEGGLAGRDIAPLAFLGSRREGYLNFSQHEDNLFAWSYVGSEEYFRELIEEYVGHARSNGLRPNFLSLIPLDEVGGRPYTATPFGAVQRLDDLAAFSLKGGRDEPAAVHGAALRAVGRLPDRRVPFRFRSVDGP